MMTGSSGIGGLADAIAGLCGTRVVLLCFTRENLPQSDATGQFLLEVSDTFGGRVAVWCVRPEEVSDLADEFTVAGTITLVLFVRGREVARSVGEGGKTMMRKLIEIYVRARYEIAGDQSADTPEPNCRSCVAKIGLRQGRS